MSMSNIAYNCNINQNYVKSNYNPILEKLVNGKNYYSTYDKYMDENPPIEYDEKFKENTQRTKNYSSFRKYLEKNHFKNCSLQSNTELLQPNVSKKTHCQKKQLGSSFWNKIEKNNLINSFIRNKETNVSNIVTVINEEKNKRSYRKSIRRTNNKCDDNE